VDHILRGIAQDGPGNHCAGNRPELACRHAGSPLNSSAINCTEACSRDSRLENFTSRFTKTQEGSSRTLDLFGGAVLALHLTPRACRIRRSPRLRWLGCCTAS
jgi:hypothetical protein